MQFFEFFALVDALEREVRYYHERPVRIELDKDHDGFGWRVIFYVQSKNETVDEADAKHDKFMEEYYLQRMDQYKEINPLIMFEFLEDDKKEEEHVQGRRSSNHQTVETESEGS